jgi:hypothetical protein
VRTSIVPWLVVAAFAVSAATGWLWLPRFLGHVVDNPHTVDALAKVVYLLLGIGALLKPVAEVLRFFFSRQEQAVLHKLPPPPDRFIGRQAKIKELTERIRKKKIAFLCLSGMPGAGKTALALVIAKRVKKRYPDEQFFIDLKGTTDPVSPAHAMASVIRRFNPELKEPDDLAEVIGTYQDLLQKKRILLVMDNVASEDQVRSLLPPPTSFMLITSRNRLGYLKTLAKMWKFCHPMMLRNSS